LLIKSDREECNIGINKGKCKVFARQAVFPVLLVFMILPIRHLDCDFLVNEAQNDNDDRIYD
jgi:hypothetical protein